MSSLTDCLRPQCCFDNITMATCTNSHFEFCASMQACPKCNYVRQPNDTNPEWQCPACGVAYSKVNNQAPRRTASVSKQRESGHKKSSVYSARFRLPGILIAAIVFFFFLRILSGDMSWSQKNKTATPAFATGVHINDPVIKEFSISGSNFSELNEVVLRVGPFDAETNRRWWGMTRWNISWKFSHATENNQCRLDQFALILDGVIDLPDFANRHSASEEMKAKWDSFIKALRVHEYGHWSTGIDAIMTSRRGCSKSRLSRIATLLIGRLRLLALK